MIWGISSVATEFQRLGDRFTYGVRTEEAIDTEVMSPQRNLPKCHLIRENNKSSAATAGTADRGVARAENCL